MKATIAEQVARYGGRWLSIGIIKWLALLAAHIIAFICLGTGAVIALFFTCFGISLDTAH